MKWKRPFYGLPDLGWVIEMAAYDVSVIRTLEEAEGPEMNAWIEQAARVPGWLWSPKTS